MLHHGMRKKNTSNVGRTHTPTGLSRTLGAVMLVLLVCSAVLVWFFLVGTDSVLAATQGDGIIVYGESTVTTPRTRTWASSAWGDEGSMVAAAAMIRHVVTKSSVTRDEMLAGIQTTDGTLYIQRYDGSAWSAEWNVTVGDGNLPRFDIAFELTSGDAMVVYSKNVGATNEMAYRIWNGTSWTAETTYDAVRTSGIVDALALEGRGSSDDIALVWGDRNFDLSANYWDGTNNVWKTEPTAALETNLAKVGTATTLTNLSFDLAFESTSGELLLAWGANAVLDGKYVTRTAGAAGTWSSVTTNTSFFEEPTDMELSPDPNSDFIAYTNSSDNGADADAAIWTGSAWSAFSNFDTAIDTVGAGTSNNAVNWVTSGGQTRAVVTYDDANASGIDWLYYNKNTGAWSALQADYTGAPAPAGADDKLHRFRANPFNQAELMLIVVDANADLFAKKLTFDGTNFTWTSTEPGGAALETSVSSITGFAVDFSFLRYIPSAGSLTVDIVDGSGNSVASPSMAMNAIQLSFVVQTATGTFGASSQKVRVTNTTATATWTLSVAASASTAVWDSAGTDYDFNDPTANAGDGGDADSVGGQMTMNASAGTITPQTGCSTTGLTKGSSASFSEGVANSVTLITAGASAETNCYWELTDVSVSQTVPEEQPVASDYGINMTLTVVAN